MYKKDGGALAMIVIMKKGSAQAEVKRVVDRLEQLGFGIHLSEGVEKTIIGAIGGDRVALAEANIEAFPGVERVTPISKPYKLVGREWKPADTLVNVGGVTIGGNTAVVIAGPCAVESRAGFLAAARVVKKAGGHILRGGAFKPRTSPYSFQGLAEEGLKIMAEARAETGLPLVTEVIDPRDVDLVAGYVDMLQIGTRNAQNYQLLKAAGQAGKPVLLKRGFANTIEEWLLAAEYIMSEGNYQVVLCERGIRTYEPATRFTLDLNAVPLVKQLSHLPVLVDPSHGTGKRDLVSPMARAAIAAGADGVAIEVHPRPDEAVSDGAQTITPEQFDQLLQEVAMIAAAMGRSLEAPREAKALHAD